MLKAHHYSQTAIKKTKSNHIVRYAWGNSIKKTWFITKNNKALLPKGSKLLFIISGKETDKKIKTSDTYPKEGDVIFDVNSSKIEVTDVKWVKS